MLLELLFCIWCDYCNSVMKIYSFYLYSFTTVVCKNNVNKDNNNLMVIIIMIMLLIIVRRVYKTIRHCRYWKIYGISNMNSIYIRIFLIYLEKKENVWMYWNISNHKKLKSQHKYFIIRIVYCIWWDYCSMFWKSFFILLVFYYHSQTHMQ